MPWTSVFNSTAVIFVCVCHFKTSETLMVASTQNTPLQIKPIRSEAETGMQCSYKAINQTKCIKRGGQPCAEFNHQSYTLITFNSMSERSLAE